ncbi:MAG TPA: hypothetical protein VM577_12225 [Anaerovoracaceae bacterium]|nr:hypothetical protein [Anaerovoracaceae bacterium]
MKAHGGELVCAVLVFLLLAGCSGGGSGISPDSHRLTQKQMLADYDAMWKNIDENYPLMGVAERVTKKDFARCVPGTGKSWPGQSRTRIFLMCFPAAWGNLREPGT